MTIPNTIDLITRGRHEESPADNGNILPGHLLQKQANGKVAPHATAGGGPNSGVLVAKEDAYQAGTIYGVYNLYTAAYTGYVTDNVVFYLVASKGDKVLMRLASGQNVTAQTQLMSNGDGTLIAWFGPTLYQIVATSTTITNTNVETAFSNGSYAVAASTLLVGDKLRIRGRVYCIAENSTNTHRIRVYVGATTLVDSTALQLAAADFVEFDITLTIRTVGASGTFVGQGTLTYSVGAAVTATAVSIASTTIDTTVAETVAAKSLASATSAGNQIRLDQFEVGLDRPTGLTPLVQADEAVNNSGGTTPFIRVIVL